MRNYPQRQAEVSKPPYTVSELIEAYNALKLIANSRYCGNCDLGYVQDDCTCGNYELDNVIDQNRRLSPK